MTPAWLADAVGYQVYIRSFADGDGDGVGDLRGVIDRLDHLSWLGVNLVWLNPFFPSPGLDAGYDVADHCDVDPRLGTLADLDDLLVAAHERGLRVIIDLVPNHTSAEHAWFQQARTARDDPHRDYYVWRDPAPDGGPPNNWVSVFGGPAWTFDEATGQYWLHLFLPEMPDLNWRNPAVAAEFDRIVRFWLDRGVDGFRIDVAHGLLKHPDLTDLPPAPDDDRWRDHGAGAASAFDRLDHVFDIDQPGTPALYRPWREMVEQRDGLLIGEVYLLDAERVRRYVADQQGLHLSFWIKPLHRGDDPDALGGALREGADALGRWGAWPLGNHDRPRLATALGGGRRGRERALAVATVVFGLPGVPFVYQGEEVGLEDVAVPPEQMQDPIAHRDSPARSRDPARTPIPWAHTAGYGFTAALVRPWLPFGEHGPDETVAVQREDPDSILHRFRALVATRRSLAGLTGAAPPLWLEGDRGAVVAFRRGDALVAANLSDEPARQAVPEGSWSVAFATDPCREGETLAGTVALPPRGALIAAG